MKGPLLPRRQLLAVAFLVDHVSGPHPLRRRTRSRAAAAARRDLSRRRVVARAGGLQPYDARPRSPTSTASPAIPALFSILQPTGRITHEEMNAGQAVRRLPRRDEGERRAGRLRPLPPDGRRRHERRAALRLHPLHRLRRVQRRLQGGERPAAADRGSHHGLHLDDGASSVGGAQRAPAVLPLRRADLRLGLPGRRAAEDRRRDRSSTTRRAASAAATASWPARSACRSTSGTSPSRSSASASCAPTASAAGCRPRAPRSARPARRCSASATSWSREARGAHRRQPGHLRRSRLRPRRGRRHLGAHAVERALRAARA